MPEVHTRAQAAATWLSIALAYYATAWVGIRLAVFPESASAVWPATGVAIAALTLAGPRYWSAVTVGAILAEWPVFGPTWATVVAIGITLEGTAGAVAMRRIGGHQAFSQGKGVGQFILIITVVPVVSAAIGTLVVWATGGPTPLPHVAATWYFGDALGALIVAPPVLLLLGGAPMQRRVPAEGYSLVTATALLAFVAFYPWRPADLEPIRLGFIVVGPVIWAAVRFGPLVTSWTALGLAAAAMVGLHVGTVPIYGDANQVLLQMQALTALVAVLGLILAANVHQRNTTIAMLHEHQAELQRALEAVQESQRTKTRFLNKAAHEMKTPLTPIRLRAHMLSQAPDLPAVHLPAVQAIARNADRLSRLVDDLLAAARVQATGDALVLHDIAVRNVLTRAANQASNDAVTRGLTIETRCDDAIARADPDAAQRVLSNLLSNAIFHSPKGSFVELQGQEAGPDVVIRVVDHGPGIPAAERERVFEPFASSKDAHPGEGSGLGLYTARALAASMGGSITLSDTAGGGVTAEIRLPAGGRRAA